MMKRIAVIALVLLLIGGILAGVGYALGGAFHVTGAELEHGVISAEAPADTITGAELSLAYGDFRIERDDGRAFTVEGKNVDLLRSRVDEDGRWTLESADDRRDALRKIDAVIYLPEAPLDVLEIEGSAQTIALGTLEARTIELDLSAGEMSADALTCEALEAHTAAGAMLLGVVDAQSLEAEVQAGSVTGTLLGTEADYRWEGEARLGTVVLGGRALSDGLGDEFSGGSGPRSLELTAQAGNLTLGFAG